MTAPRLHPKAVRNPIALGEVLDQWLRQNQPVQAAGKALLRSERALRVRCDLLDKSGVTWRLFLRIDEIHVARLADALHGAVVWAFREGRRSKAARGAR